MERIENTEDHDTQGVADGELIQIVDEADQVSHQDGSDHVQNNLEVPEVPESDDTLDVAPRTRRVR